MCRFEIGDKVEHNGKVGEVLECDKIPYVKFNNDGEIEIRSFCEESLKPCELTPKDLIKTGMIVVTNDDKRYIVLKDVDTRNYGRNDVLMGDDGFLVLSDYDECTLFNENMRNDERFDIKLVVKPVTPRTCNLDSYNLDMCEIIWSRPEKPKGKYPEIKGGMLVEFRNGKLGNIIDINGTLKMVTKNSLICCDFDSKLCDNITSELDVMKVYVQDCDNPRFLNTDDYELIWTREE